MAKPECHCECRGRKSVLVTKTFSDLMMTLSKAADKDMSLLWSWDWGQQSEKKTTTMMKWKATSPEVRRIHRHSYFSRRAADSLSAFPNTRARSLSPHRRPRSSGSSSSVFTAPHFKHKGTKTLGEVASTWPPPPNPHLALRAEPRIRPCCRSSRPCGFLCSRPRPAHSFSGATRVTFSHSNRDVSRCAQRQFWTY